METFSFLQSSCGYVLEPVEEKESYLICVKSDLIIFCLTFFSVDMDMCDNAPFKERLELARRNLQFEIKEEEDSEYESSHSSELGCRVMMQSSQIPNSFGAFLASSSTTSASEPIRPPQLEQLLMGADHQNKKKGVSISRLSSRGGRMVHGPWAHFRFQFFVVKIKGPRFFCFFIKII